MKYDSRKYPLPPYSLQEVPHSLLTPGSTPLLYSPQEVPPLPYSPQEVSPSSILPEEVPLSPYSPQDVPPPSYSPEEVRFLGLAKVTDTDVRQHLLLEDFLRIFDSLLPRDTGPGTARTNEIESHVLLLNDKRFVEGRLHLHETI